MADYKTKVLRIFYQTLISTTGLKCDKLSEKIGVTGQTIRNRLNESNSARNWHDACDQLNKLIKSDELPNNFYAEFEKNLKTEGISPPHRIFNDSFDKTMEYLIEVYPSHENRWASDRLLDRLSRIPLLKDILEQKLLLNAERYGFFKLDFITNTTFKLKFWNCNHEFSYKVLVYYLPLDEWNDSGFTDLSFFNERRKKENDADMILRFTFFSESQEILYACMRDNIYMDKINLKSISYRQKSKDFIYDEQGTASDQGSSDQILANQFSDAVLSHLTKYFIVIYKNMFFNSSHINAPDVKRKSLRTPWNMKFADLATLTFEKDILFEKIVNEKYDLVIILGFLDFEFVKKLSGHFKKIVCLDNSCKCAQVYSDYLKQYLPKNGNVCDIEVLPFTSSVSEYVSKQYALWQQADFVLCGLGNASLIRSVKTYIRLINRWLKPGGYAWFSFFNEKFFYDYQSRNNISRSSSVVPLPEEQRALIFNQETKQRNDHAYYVYCKLYESGALRDMLGASFHIEKFYSYPLISLLANEQPPMIRNILNAYDFRYSKTGVAPEEYDKISFADLRGFYLNALVQKESADSVIRIPEFSEAIDDHPHDTVVLKTVMLQIKGSGNTAPVYYIVLLDQKFMLPQNKNEDIFLNHQVLKLLDVREINRLGFETGNIPPFFNRENNADRNFQLHRFYYQKNKMLSSRYYQFESGTKTGKITLPQEAFQAYLEQYHYRRISE